MMKNKFEEAEEDLVFTVPTPVFNIGIILGYWGEGNQTNANDLSSDSEITEYPWCC